MNMTDGLAFVSTIVSIIVPIASLIWYIINHGSARKKIFLASLLTVLVMAALLVIVKITIPTSPPTSPRPKITVIPRVTVIPRIPNIAGYYSGSYTRTGQSGKSPMQMRINQSGQNLTGTTTEGSINYIDTGTIKPDGSFTIIENGSIYLYGSVVSPGHLSGTWNNLSASANGTWDVRQT